MQAAHLPPGRPEVEDVDTHCVCTLCQTAGLGFYPFLSTWIKSDMFDHLGRLEYFPDFT
jgi:hypothetical protein